MLGREAVVLSHDSATVVKLQVDLVQGGQLVIYGCMGGKPPSWPWQSWVFKDLQVQLALA